MGRLYLHTASILGGSERAFLDHLRRLSEKERQQCLIVVPSQGDLVTELRAIDSKLDIQIIPFPSIFEKLTRKSPLAAFLKFPLYSVSMVRFLGRLESLIRERNISLIYSNGIKCHIYSLFLKKPGRILIWHMQDYFPKFLFVRLFLQSFSKGPDAVFSNSESVQSELKKSVPSAWLENTKFTVIHNAVDTNFFRVARNASPQIRISMVGMLTPWKGHEVFIEALKILETQNLSISYHAQIVGGEVYQTEGETGYRKLLEEKVKKSGLENRISFTGLVKDVEKVYRNSEIVVHCSTRPEPFGRVIIEAMACGCAVIATQAGGVVEIIRDGVDGFLIPMNDPKALAAKLKELVTNDNLRNQISKTARLTAEEKFSAERFHRKIEDSLEKVV